MMWRQPPAPQPNLLKPTSKFPRSEAASLPSSAAAWKMNHDHFLRDGSANSTHKADINSSLIQMRSLLALSGRIPTTTSNTLAASTPQSAAMSNPSTQAQTKPISQPRAVKMMAITFTTLTRTIQQRVELLHQIAIPICHPGLTANSQKVSMASAAK